MTEREKAIKDLKFVRSALNDDLRIAQSYDMAISALSENIGEWIPKYSTTNAWDIDLVCSKCGYVGIENYAHGYGLDEIDMQEVRNYAKKLDMNFCTCCGCNMRGGKCS